MFLPLEIYAEVYRDKESWCLEIAFKWFCKTILKEIEGEIEQIWGNIKVENELIEIGDLDWSIFLPPVTISSPLTAQIRSPVYRAHGGHSIHLVNSY